jgi:hypothetical protein
MTNKLTKDISGGSTLLITIYRFKPCSFFLFCTRRNVFIEVSSLTGSYTFFFAVAEWGSVAKCIHLPNYGTFGADP